MRANSLQRLSRELLKPAICDETARICQARYGIALRAVVLSGSLSRDEATFIEEGRKWRLLGDADFFLVFENKSRLPLPRDVESAAQEIKAALHANDLIASVGLAAVERSYLRGLPRHIAPYELVACGEVICGETNILSIVPKFTPEQISREDAWRMLANRIIELLEAVAQGDQPREEQYRTVKLFLDMATSYLVFVGRYRPTYRERAQALRHLADASEPADAPFPLGPFSARVKECTEFKLDGTRITRQPEALLSETVAYAHQLWRWELRTLAGEGKESSDAELMSKWMNLQPLSARLRGWASWIRRSGGYRSWKDFPRWIRLGRQASPRYWVYSVASTAFFQMPATPAPDRCATIRELARKLPVPSAASTTDWHELMKITALNYRRLLEATTA